MSFYNTGNPVPSIDPRDLDDNAKHIDEAVNSTSPTFVDRKGATRKTLAGIEADADAVTLRSDLIANPSFAYKKTVKAFPYRHPQYDAAVALFGSVYPQSFYIDPAADEVLFLGATGQVTVFVWSSRAYKKTYQCPTPFVSENMVIKYQGATRLMYLRGTGVMAVYDITTTTQWQVLSPTTTYPINVQRNFAEHGGEWLISNDGVVPLGQFKSRGYFGVYDSNFSQIGDLYFSALQCGINEGPPLEGTISKMQGMDFDGSTVYLGMGGYWNGTTDTNKKYGAYGVRTLTRQGTVTGDYLLDPEKVMAKLASVGYTPDHCENEGVQFVKSTGRIYSLMVGLQSSSTVSTAQAEGLYILEEFSTAVDAIDFSDCATTRSTFPDVLRDSSVLYPRSGAGLINPLTGTPFVGWTDIIAYMKSVDMSAFRYYSSNVALLDFNGAAVAAGQLVTIYNANNSTFWVEASGFGLIRRWRVTTVQTEHQPAAALNHVPLTTNTVSSGTTALRWTDSFAIQYTIGAGTVRMLSGSGTPEGVVTAVVGSTFQRSDGGASTTLYVKQSGAGNTGWVAK